MFLGEYVAEEVVEELRMQKSIGQVLGIPTAGDRRRAAERAARRKGKAEGKAEGLAEGEEKANKRFAARDKKIAKFLRLNGVSRKLLNAALAIK